MASGRWRAGGSRPPRPLHLLSASTRPSGESTGGLLPSFALYARAIPDALVNDSRQADQSSYTIALTPSRSECIEITVKREELGLVSRYFHQQTTVGDYLKVNAPFGEFTFTGGKETSLVLVACSVGITLMMSIVRYLSDTRNGLKEHRRESEHCHCWTRRHCNRIRETASRNWRTCNCNRCRVSSSRSLGKSI